MKTATPDQDAVFATERQELVHLCARLTGDVVAAEDVAQETLLRAWRHGHQLREPARRRQWLAAIARNECRRWLQRHRRTFEPREASPSGGESPAGHAERDIAADIDLDVELERHELAQLLDRAMRFLPPETRAALVARYVDESPQAAIAVHAGLTEGAVAMRLQRGRLALRRVLTTELRDEASAFGLLAPTGTVWQETRIWCPLCGNHRLLGRFVAGIGELKLRCDGCCGRDWESLANGGDARTFRGVRGYRAATATLVAWADDIFRGALADRCVPCPVCGRRTPVSLRPAAAPSPLPGSHFLAGACPACHVAFANLAAALGLCTPAGRRFWRDHPRLRLLPEREVEADGGRALVSGFRDATGPATLDVLVSLDTFQVLRVRGDGDA